MWYNIYFSQVEFLQKLFIEKINIYETYHAGGVMRIQAKHPNGSWYAVWQTKHVFDLHSSRIFSPHFDVCIIHVRYIDCEGKREMWILWQLVFFMYKSDNLWWNEVDTHIVVHMFVIKMMSFCHRINSSFMPQFGNHNVIFCWESLSYTIYWQGHLRISWSWINSSSWKYI